MAEPTLSPALGADDYKALYGMLTSDDEGQRKQAQAMAGKLTSSEAQEFFDFQHAVHGPSPELHREDNSLLGAPPELAVAGALGIGGAVAKAGAAGASKLAAAGKAAVGMAAPAVKYEATKTVLEKLGVPSPMAVVAAMAMAGYKGGAKEAPAAAAEGSVADKVAKTLARTPQQITDEAISAGRAEGAARAVQPSPPPTVDMAGQPSILTPEATAGRLATVGEQVAAPVAPKVLNELAIEARRAKVTLTPSDYGGLILKVRSGSTPAEAVAELAASKVSPAEALAKSLGTPSDSAVADALNARYAKGELRTPSAELAKLMRSKR